MNSANTYLPIARGGGKDTATAALVAVNGHCKCLCWTIVTDNRKANNGVCVTRAGGRMEPPGSRSILDGERG